MAQYGTGGWWDEFIEQGRDRIITKSLGITAIADKYNFKLSRA